MRGRVGWTKMQAVKNSFEGFGDSNLTRVTICCMEPPRHMPRALFDAPNSGLERPVRWRGNLSTGLDCTMVLTNEASESKETCVGKGQMPKGLNHFLFLHGDAAESLSLSLMNHGRALGDVTRSRNKTWFVSLVA